MRDHGREHRNGTQIDSKDYKDYNDARSRGRDRSRDRANIYNQERHQVDHRFMKILDSPPSRFV